MDEIKVLTQLNKDHVQQSIDDHIKIVELTLANKRMKEALRKLQRVTTIDNSFNGPDIGGVG